MNRRFRVTRCLTMLLGLAFSAGAAAAMKNPFYVAFVSGRDQLILAFRSGEIVAMSVPDLEIVRHYSSAAEGKLKSVAVAGNGRWLAAKGSKTDTKVWNLESGEVQLTVPGSPSIFLFHPREDLLYFNQGTLVAWDVVRGSVSDTIRPLRTVFSMSFSPDGRNLVVAGECRTAVAAYALCVYGLSEQLILAGVELEQIHAETGGFLLASTIDVAYAAPDRILVAPGGFDDVLALSPSDLRFLESVTRDEFEEFAGPRSAPHRKEEDRSHDGQWHILIARDRHRLDLYAPNEHKGLKFGEKLVNSAEFR